MKLRPGAGRLASSTAIVPLIRIAPRQAITTEDRILVQAVVQAAEPYLLVAATLQMMGTPQTREEQLLEALRPGFIQHHPAERRE